MPHELPIEVLKEDSPSSSDDPCKLDDDMLRLRQILQEKSAIHEIEAPGVEGKRTRIAWTKADVGWHSLALETGGRHVHAHDLNVRMGGADRCSQMPPPATDIQ